MFSLSFFLCNNFLELTNKTTFLLSNIITFPPLNVTYDVLNFVVVIEQQFMLVAYILYNKQLFTPPPPLSRWGRCSR